MRKMIQIGLSFGILVSLATTAEARMFVVTSDTPDYPVKKVIEPGETLKLAPGKKIKVMLPDGTTRELSSANNGAVAALLQSVKPASWWEEIIELARAGGGSSRPGAVRSITAKPPVFAVDGITGSKFRLCVEAGTQPAVTRDQTTGVHAVTIVAETGNKQVIAEFAAGQAKLAWPAGFEIADGQTYRVMPENAAPMAMEMRVVARGLNGEAQVQALGAAGCTRQAAAAMQALAK